ncbi:MAG: carboxypeptidase-like regulatory domain-containing protein, partial [Acidimicrobiia bacterium]|nr:carboxypeptidase-like regulatory domain-containing protein [Acidimicrobiia bacterium]
DGDGVRDPEEIGLEGVYVKVGGWAEITDAAGRFAAWNISPFEAIPIEIDTMAIADPRLVVLQPRVAVHAAPNSFLTVDLPVVMGAEVAGFLLLDGQTLAGAPVEFRNLRTGTVITVMTFADGGFYEVGVPPGEYEVGVPDMLLEELGATYVPLTISIPTGPAADEVQWDDLVVRLTR